MKRVILAALTWLVPFAFATQAAADATYYRDSYYWAQTPPDQQALMIACDAEMNAYGLDYARQHPENMSNRGDVAFTLGEQIAPQILKRSRSETESNLAQYASETGAAATVARCMTRAHLAHLGEGAGPGSAPAPRAAPAPVARSAPPPPARSTPAPSSSAAATPDTPYQVAEREAASALDDVLSEVGAKAHTAKPEPKVGEEGEDAAQCLNPPVYPVGPYDGQKLHNHCAYKVSAAWCVEGYDCKPSYSNMHTFGAQGETNDTWPMFGTSGENRGRIVQFGACRGVNTLDTLPELYSYHCTKELK